MRIALVLLFGSIVAGQTGSTMPPESERQLAREIYQEIIAVMSGYTTGSTTPVVEAVRRRLRGAGFPDADIFVGGASPAKANLVVRYKGTGRRKPLLLLAHTDVVETKRDDRRAWIRSR
jgi:acetylornithine deacetylase/succinyl-diaminopimelate desuccinylase-like protein